MLVQGLATNGLSDWRYVASKAFFGKISLFLASDRLIESSEK